MSRDGATLTLDPAQLVSMMFALLPVPVAITDSRGRVILCNSCFTDVFQSTNMPTEPQREVEVPGHGIFQVQTLPLTDQGYKIVFASDVTDQTQLRKRAARLEKMAAIGRVVTGVANELETPLADIASYAFLVERSSLTPELRQIVGTLLMRAERASHLVQSLSVLGGVTPRTTPFDINTVVRNVVQLRSRRQEADIEIALDLDNSLPGTVGDPSLIEQVVLTLLINAEDAIAGNRQPGLISLRTCLRNNRVQLHVSNNGPARDAGRVFDLGEGGVGLNICAEIAKDHDGELYGWSSYGSGTTLTLELPIYAEEENISASGRRLKGKTVIVVDDEAHITEFVDETLSRCGAIVDIAHSGSEAFERFKTKPYDLVICDRHMPGVSGQGLYRLVQDMDPESTQRFLFLTSDPIPAETRHFFSEHRVHFLRRPFNGQELLKTIEHLFSQDEPQDF